MGHYTFWNEFESVCLQKEIRIFLGEIIASKKRNYGFSILQMHKILCCFVVAAAKPLEKVNCNEESILLRDPQFVRIWVSSLLLLLCSSTILSAPGLIAMDGSNWWIFHQILTQWLCIFFNKFFYLFSRKFTYKDINVPFRNNLVSDHTS